jgi:beta-aspartyl-peptidase (threonine type)
MIVVTSTNGRVGIQESMRVLKAGGSAVDAVEAGIRLVEANPDEHSVGYAGLPNLLGQVELDAAIMDGQSMTSGAVGAMKGYVYAISVARKVMERLPHVFLVGEGAERFADEMGFERCDLLTPEVQEVWAKHLHNQMPGEDLTRLAERSDLWKWVELATDPERAYGTVNFIARDARGDICAGVSTSGWAWKYPGRLGDSPVVGAGLYADNRLGAATCTGMGEMAIRAATARSAVLYLKMGMSLEEAGQQLMDDLGALGGRYLSVMNFILMDREGRHTAFSNFEDRTYLYLCDTMEEPVELPRCYVQAKLRWGDKERSTP